MPIYFFLFCSFDIQYCETSFYVLWFKSNKNKIIFLTTFSMEINFNWNSKEGFYFDTSKQIY